MANKKMNLDGKHEKVISYNGEVITFQLSTVKAASGGTEKASLCFYRRTFQILSGQFVENFTGQYNFSSSYSVIEFVCVNCVGDTRTGLTLPCVLLRHGKKKKSTVAKCHLFMLHSSNNLECRLKWKVDFETVHDLQMCDGPTVVWRHHNQLFYVSPQTSGILNASINISSIHWAGELKPKGILILGITDDSFQESGDDGENVINHPEKQFIAYSTEEQKTMPGSCFLPSAYSSVVRCLQVCTMHIKNDKYETSVVAASSKQLIWFHNGVPREVCQLPFENPFKLQVAFTSRGDLLFIVSFISGDVCAIWKDSWQIAATWHHVRSILVDDFIGTGSDQLLLLFNNIPDMSADQQRFQITDCGEINYPSNLYNEKEGSSAEEGYHENRFRIIQALETRLQAGLRSVQEMQQHLQVKERVLKSSCETLFDMLQGKETILHCAEEEGLVSLWDDSLHISYPSESEATSLSTDSECFVEKIWHRVVDNFFVIGVKLYPSIYLSLSNVALSLLMDEEITSLSPVTKCQTNVLKMAIRSLFDYNASYQTEPVAKKQRLDSHNKDNLSRDSTERPCSSSYQNDLEHTVTAVTELSPLLALNNTSCVLLLHARRENQPDSILKREKLTVPCGRISLSLEEVLKGNHTVNVFEHCQGDVHLENVLALLSVYEKRSFRIWSPDYTLVSVKAWLLGPMQGKPIKQLPDLIFSCLPGSLHGTLFIWIPGTPCEGTLTIFYRTEPGLLQCLYSLKCVLPPTCVVNTISVGGKYCLTENLAQSMEEELIALRGSASAAASDVEKEMKQRCFMKTKTSNTIGPLSDTKERVQKYREELQIEQKQSKLGVPLTTSCNMYRHIAFNVAEIQMKTDTIAFKLSQS